MDSPINPSSNGYLVLQDYPISASGSPRTRTGSSNMDISIQTRLVYISYVVFNYVNLETGRRTIPIVYVYMYINIYIYISNCDTYCVICIYIYIYIYKCVCVFVCVHAVNTCLLHPPVRRYGGRLFFTGPPRMKSISFASHWVLPPTAGLGTVACNVAPSTSC